MQLAALMDEDEDEAEAKLRRGRAEACAHRKNYYDMHNNSN